MRRSSTRGSRPSRAARRTTGRTSPTSTRSEGSRAIDRLLPDPAPTTVDEQLAGFEPAALAGSERPYAFTNFALTLDGRATIAGRSGPIGSATDTAMLVGLRCTADAVLIGAGTLRVERYGPLAPTEEQRARRERRGLAHAPLAVLVTGTMELPWEAELFTCGYGRVLILTTDQAGEPPSTETPVRVERHRGGQVDLGRALAYLRAERGVRSLLCEGGPRLHGELLTAGLVDELFVTHAAKLGGGVGPGLAEGLPEAERPLELAWLLREGDELFARYRVRRR